MVNGAKLPTRTRFRNVCVKVTQLVMPGPGDSGTDVPPLATVPSAKKERVDLPSWFVIVCKREPFSFCTRVAEAFAIWS